MKIQQIYNEVVNDYKSQKIPVGNIFYHDNIHSGGYNSEILSHIDIFTTDEEFRTNPVVNIPVNKIVPTQTFINRNNLNAVKDNLKANNTGAYLVSYNGLYYVVDGHHRIANRIINGDATIKGYIGKSK